METIAIIPARGGSKGIPGKNIRLLAGIPLIAHSIVQARQARRVDRVCVSTDSADIASVAREYGAEVIDRPAEIAGDTASSESALEHALEVVTDAGRDPGLIVFLQCTSPVRAIDDIDSAIDRLRAEGADSLLSVVPTHKFIWEERGGEAIALNYDYRERPRRQDMDLRYEENGSIYVFKPEILRKYHNRLGGKIVLYVMDENTKVDIDSLADFALAEILIARNG